MHKGDGSRCEEWEGWREKGGGMAKQIENLVEPSYVMFRFSYHLFSN